MGTAAEQLLNGTYGSYLLLAIPLFILAATFMSSGSIVDRLLRFCNAIVGRFPGGLAQVTACCRAVSAVIGAILASCRATRRLAFPPELPRTSRREICRAWHFDTARLVLTGATTEAGARPSG